MLVSFASSWLPSSKLLVNARALSTRAYERQGWGLCTEPGGQEKRDHACQASRQGLAPVVRVTSSLLSEPQTWSHSSGQSPQGGMEELPRQNPGCPWMIPLSMLKRLTGMGSSPWLCDTLQDVPPFWELLRFHGFCLCFLVRSSLSTC